MDHDVLVLGPDVTQGFPRLGTLLQGKAEKGDTHISQASHPRGVPSSGGRLCSSAGLGSVGHAWRRCTLCATRKVTKVMVIRCFPNPTPETVPLVGLTGGLASVWIEVLMTKLIVTPLDPWSVLSKMFIDDCQIDWLA